MWCLIYSTVPLPRNSVSREPDASVRLRHGDNLTLTCTIQLDPNPAVDSDVVVTGRLQGAGRNSTIVTSSDGVYKVMLHIPSLRATSSDTYTCTGTVEPGSGVMYVQRSESHYSLNITVGMQLLLHSLSLHVQSWHLTLDHYSGLQTVRVLFVYYLCKHDMARTITATFSPTRTGG